MLEECSECDRCGKEFKYLNELKFGLRRRLFVCFKCYSEIYDFARSKKGA